MNKPFKTVKMFGPSLSTGEIVNMDVPVADVQAYRAAGFKEGSMPKKEIKGVLVSSDTAGTGEAVQLDPKNAKPVTRAKKSKDQ